MSSANILDISIIGFGAGGLSILQQYIRNTSYSKDKSIRIGIFEKSTTLATGLAYSTELNCNILNMSSKTMSIDPENANQFWDWLQDNQDIGKKFGKFDINFPPRGLYGVYLQHQFDAIQQEAIDKNIEIIVVKDLVTNAQELDGQVIIGTKKNGSFYTKKAVLALGSIPSHLYKNFFNLPGYFSSPWPENKLSNIPNDESVFIVGSRLSAIDAVLSLVSKGHTGKIILLSRSGLLPKVQNVDVNLTSYNSDWLSLYEKVKNNPKNTFQSICEGFIDILKKYNTDAVSLFKELQKERSATATLERDIQNAESNACNWQSILQSSAPYIEKFWDLMTEEEQELFMKNYNTIWHTFRHCIPLINAKKIIQLLHSSQLEVLKIGLQNVTYSEDETIFSVAYQTPKLSGILESKYLINATGEGLLTDQSQPLLVHNLLKSGSATLDYHGTLKVDFNTLQLINCNNEKSTCMYVIGSLTKGTHFYTHAIDRIVEHSKRIVRSIIKTELLNTKLSIAFFMGTDIMSHLMLNKLVPVLTQQGHTITIYYTQDSVNTKTKPYYLEELAFWERRLLHEIVFPYIDSNNIVNMKCLSPKQLSEIYGVSLEYVSSVNEQSTINSLHFHATDVGISLRCYQRFQSTIITYFDQKGKYLLNLHPGILPYYRGVITTIRSMFNGESSFGYTLHKIDKNYDAGEIISIKSCPIDYNKPMLSFMYEVFPMGVSMIEKCISDISSGKYLQGDTQSDTLAEYYTFPTEEEIHAFHKKNVFFLDAEDMKKIYFDNFCIDDSKHHNKLKEYIRDHINKWYMQNPTPLDTIRFLPLLI